MRHQQLTSPRGQPLTQPSLLQSTTSATINDNSACSAVQVVTVTAGAAPAPDVAAGIKVQVFTGSLGGPPPPVVSGRPTVYRLEAAIGRSCDIQHNACADAANNGSLAGGVGQCDDQSAACRQPSSNNPARRKVDSKPANNRRTKRALNLGSCTNPTILFQPGLDGRNRPAFIAQNQDDFNHGSALNIGVIAGFICQKLSSPCGAGKEVQASCSRASAAARAADVFNGIMSGNFIGDVTTSLATTASADLAGDAVGMGVAVMTFTSCS
ncbi:hypothetical protein QBC46DRAFT_365890 [Diplogelasinospora grovesii]|uniref:Uncharacterized protein n=1 Tax=Diplogelasinospora grovesii TaxID=303347 RepID=A0AAN6S2R9_9PEZI|nr:hypothetical protein QBC46DRAFT_365890 [Diplogelasinospora grovesii]